MKTSFYQNSFRKLNTFTNYSKVNALRLNFGTLYTDVFENHGYIKSKSELPQFYEDISFQIFNKKNEINLQKKFLKLLNEEKAALSSSILKNVKNPSSAVAIKLNSDSSDGKILTSFTDSIYQGKGVGINLSEFKNPDETVKKINSYFKYIENSNSKPVRKPAGIALLDITHPKIIDFITLKDNENYKDWCFDLSVIIPPDFIKKVENNEDITLDNGQKIKASTIYDSLLNSMLKKGEPGIIFSDNKKYICDSCGARELKENENFVISHINLSEFKDAKTNSINKNELKNASYILSKAISKIAKNGTVGVVGYQELLDKLQINYGSKSALDTLSECLKIIKSEAVKNNIKLAISPTGTVSKCLNVTPNIQPANYDNISYYDQLNTLSAAQKYVDYNISNTIILDNHAVTNDVDNIIKYASKNNLKGITVFKP